MKFQIDGVSLASINVPNVQLNSISESSAALEFTTNCGCGGRCLSSTT